MKGWESTPIKKMGRVVTGKTPPKENPEYWNGKELFISPKDMEFDSRYILESQCTISETAIVKFKGQRIPKNTIMYTALSYGFGKIGIAPKILITNQQINSIIVNKDFDYNFIYYLLRVSTPYIFSFNSGIDTPIVPKSVFEKIELNCPPLPIQRKIAAVLSAYDDLIENNNRRIAILEKMAEELYREWFVRLRFPGHENVNIVKGVPEGWEVKKLGEIAEYLNGYPFAPDEWQQDGMPIIKIKELKEGVTSQTPRNNGEKIPKKYLVNNGDLLFSWSGSLEVVLWNGGSGLLNQHLFKVVPIKGFSRSFLYLCIKESIKLLSCLTTGATMQHIKRKELNHIEVFHGNSTLMHQFSTYVEPILQETQQIALLSRNIMLTRDRLLSRLMSGKLDVENLDIEFPPSMKEDA